MIIRNLEFASLSYLLTFPLPNLTKDTKSSVSSWTCISSTVTLHDGWSCEKLQEQHIDSRGTIRIKGVYKRHFGICSLQKLSNTTNLKRSSQIFEELRLSYSAFPTKTPEHFILWQKLAFFLE